MESAINETGPRINNAWAQDCGGKIMETKTTKGRMTTKIVISE
jgi:hypothetical protein